MLNHWLQFHRILNKLLHCLKKKKAWQNAPQYYKCLVQRACSTVKTNTKLFRSFVGKCQPSRINWSSWEWVAEQAVLASLYDCVSTWCVNTVLQLKKWYDFKLDTSGWSFIILAVHTWGVLCYKKVLRHWPAISLVGESALVCCTWGAVEILWKTVASFLSFFLLCFALCCIFMLSVHIVYFHFT